MVHATDRRIHFMDRNYVNWVSKKSRKFGFGIQGTEGERHEYYTCQSSRKRDSSDKGL